MLRITEYALWILCSIGLAFCGWFWFDGAIAQARGERELRSPANRESRDLREGDLFGRIEIPSAGLAVIVFEGTSDSTLTRGAGHLATSARPGTHGNVVLAGHRDTFFRPLKKVKRGDKVLLATPAGSFRYAVSSVTTVAPDAVEVTLPTREPVLTLITCYPFSFIGTAPERYIVRATRIP